MYRFQNRKILISRGKQRSNRNPIEPQPFKKWPFTFSYPIQNRFPRFSPAKFTVSVFCGRFSSSFWSSTPSAAITSTSNDILCHPTVVSAVGLIADHSLESVAISNFRLSVPRRTPLCRKIRGKTRENRRRIFSNRDASRLCVLFTRVVMAVFFRFLYVFNCGIFWVLGKLSLLLRNFLIPACVVKFSRARFCVVIRISFLSLPLVNNDAFIFFHAVLYARLNRFSFYWLYGLL